MNCKINYDIFSRKIQIAIWKDLPDGNAECLKMHFTKEVTQSYSPLSYCELPTAEGTAILKSLATALQEYGVMPESATTSELKAVRDELERLRAQHQQMLNTLLGEK